MARAKSTRSKIENADAVVPTEEELLAALEAELEAEQAKVAAAEAKKKEMLEQLGRKIDTEATARRGRLSAKREQWQIAERLKLSNLASTKGFNPNPDRPFETAGDGADRPERNIVRTKVEIAKAQLYSMQFSGGEKNWDLLPPPMTQAIADMGITNLSERCEAMEDTMAQQLEDGKFEKEMLAFIDELTGLGTGVMKGPQNAKKMYRTYVPSGDIWVPQIIPDPRPETKCVSITRLLPDDSTNDINECEDMIEIHHMSAMELAELKKNSGFMADQITLAMEKGPNPNTSDMGIDLANISDSNPAAFRNKYTVYEYHGPISKDTLDEIGLVPPIDAPFDKHFGEVWVVNQIVIRIELSNIEGCNKPPYSGMVWVRDPSSPFGYGIPLLLRDAQRVVNQCWHMILDNASASSQPQVVIQEDMISPHNGEYTLDPGKIWYFNSIDGDVGKAFQFFTVPNVINNLFPILEHARQGSEEESAIALMSAGLQSAEVGSDSATGQAIQHKASTVLLELKSNEIDELVIEPRLQALYDWNMQYNPDPTIKAPMMLRVRSSTDYRTKQMYVRDLEKLSVEASQNPETGEWVNKDELLKARLGLMHLPVSGIVKTVDQVNMEREQAAQNPPPPDPEMLKHERELKKLELDERRLALDEQRLMYELNQGQQREQLEFRERELNAMARMTEAETELQRVQTEKEIAFLTLAAKAESEAERNKFSANIAVMSEETKRILGGMQHTREVRNQILTQRELELKAKLGTGI